MVVAALRLVRGRIFCVQSRAECRHWSIGIIMAMHLFDTPHPSVPDRSRLQLLAAYENGSVTLWQNTFVERDTSIEGRGWETVWNTKLHIESGKLSARSLSQTRPEQLSYSHGNGRISRLQFCVNLVSGPYSRPV